MERQKRHLRAFMAVALGGSELYAGRDMTAAHARLRITDDAFDRVVGHLVDTLASLAVPTETIEAIGAKLAPLRAQIVTVDEQRRAA
jgi:hemoglobin